LAIGPGRSIVIAAADAPLAAQAVAAAAFGPGKSLVPEPSRTCIIMSENVAAPSYVELAAEIVAAYVSNNNVAQGDIGALLGQVHSALVQAGTGRDGAAREAPKPAVPVRKSIMPDYIVCLEDGKKFKSLKRHLRTRYDMSPEQYREKWGLPPDYPMVAPDYAAARSRLAKKMGLGQQRGKRAA
jgi:predicted transcriptional regulator